MNGRFLFHEERFVAVDKPPGVLVIPGRTGPADTCLRAHVEAALGTKVFVVHRLDQDTSGVVLFARDAATHRTLSMAFEHGEVKKRYLALVQGRVEQELTIDAALVKGRKGKMRVAHPGEEGKPSQTRARVREVFQAASLLELEPLTGRTHQLRVHLAHVGHPLLVDPLYGAEAPFSCAGADGVPVVLARTPLHAASIAFTLGGQKFEVASPLPDDFESVLAALRPG